MEPELSWAQELVLQMKNTRGEGTGVCGLPLRIRWTQVAQRFDPLTREVGKGLRPLHRS